MYTLRILTQNELCRTLLLTTHDYDKVYKENEDYFFELNFGIESLAKVVEKTVKELVKNHDDTDVYVFEQEEETDEPLDDYINDKYFY